MSARKRLIVQPKARADVKEVLVFTRKHWGHEQRRRHGDRLRESMRSLIDRPESGQARDEYFPGCRGLIVERHVIFYHLDGDDIVVDRIRTQPANSPHESAIPGERTKNIFSRASEARAILPTTYSHCGFPKKGQTIWASSGTRRRSSSSIRRTC